MISLEKLKILTHLQKLPKNVGDLGKLIVATHFENKSPNLVTLHLEFKMVLAVFKHFSWIVSHHLFEKLLKKSFSVVTLL